LKPADDVPEATVVNRPVIVPPASGRYTPVAAENGPTVVPLMYANSPDVVVHMSPLTGDDGAVPCGRRNPAYPVAGVVVTRVGPVLL
jgi:hypothetical protein